MHGGRLAVRVGVLGAVAEPARRAAAGVGGRARRATESARARLPRHSAHARAGRRARRHQCASYQKTTHATQVISLPILCTK